MTKITDLNKLLKYNPYLKLLLPHLTSYQKAYIR